MVACDVGNRTQVSSIGIVYVNFSASIRKNEKSLQVLMGFPGGSVVKNLPARARDEDLILALGRVP